ncbi:MAG: hypothetical protein GOMPHAMPRED_004215 [Gomphillus americanus]|uniref:Secreted protein n=1 Tax=Gomphillus americanus TaxID=1940652 RepID=A0A8H3IG17_9LECA|nr:MAG: hypothetical protein GOMPHAMPRED_004215 [Gomphillus americanus]
MRGLFVLPVIVAGLVASVTYTDDLSSTWNSVLQTRILHDYHNLMPRSHQIQRRSGGKPPRARSPSPKPNIAPSPIAKAGVFAHGPAHIKSTTADYPSLPYRYIAPGKIGDEARGHARGTYAAGALPPYSGQLESDKPVKVIAMGHTARVHVATGPGGRGHIQIASPETGLHEFTVPADSTRTESMTSQVPGGAQVRAIVHRPGKAEAFALGAERMASHSGSNELQRRSILVLG